MSISSAPADASASDRSRRFLPRSFYARAALILILPIITVQLAVAVMFLQRHYEDVTVQMTANMSREIALVRAQPDLAPRLSIRFTAPPEGIDVSPIDLSGRAMKEALMARFPDLTGVDTRSVDDTVILGFSDGTGLQFSRKQVSASNPHQLLVLMVGTALLMTAVSALFMRGQIRPIRRLARAAQAFGRGQVEDYRPTGATEVRAAGTAFLDMRNRIERHIEQRTLLLSGVSHDLRTPLTRMKLELSMMEGPEAKALGADVSAMERIIDTFLEFASENAKDERAHLDVRTLVQEAAAQAAPDRQVTVAGEAIMADVYPVGLRRGVANLVKNALKYASTFEVSVSQTPSALVIAVEDDGPGIAAQDRERAMLPFSRLDDARSNTSGNVGLGLSIVRDVARAHGGSLRLGASRLGGLKAEIVVPR